MYKIFQKCYVIVFIKEADPDVFAPRRGNQVDSKMSKIMY